ncbi:MAG TPA: hypothetical protein VHE83_12290 [Mycobacteriales bacterium]|nr:hypothetical protein [Mycobacteriales bacterium]
MTMRRPQVLSFLAATMLVTAPVAYAVSDGDYSSAKQGCTGNADNSDHPTRSEDGCYALTVWVADRTHRFVQVGVPQTPDGTSAHAVDLCIDVTGTMKCVRVDKSGSYQQLPDRPGTPITPPASPADAQLHVYFGADDNLDGGEHDSSEQVSNGASDGGGIQANVVPTTAVSWLSDILTLNTSGLLTHPLPVADAGTGACADGLCFSIQTQRRVAYTAGGKKPPKRSAADYDGHTWDPPTCAGPSDSTADCGGHSMAWWHTHNQTTYVEPGIQIYEDPDPQASPIGPYPLPAFYIGTCGLVVGGGSAPAFPASPFTNNSGQIDVETGC